MMESRVRDGETNVCLVSMGSETSHQKDRFLTMLRELYSLLSVTKIPYRSNVGEVYSGLR